MLDDCRGWFGSGGSSGQHMGGLSGSLNQRYVQIWSTYPYVHGIDDEMALHIPRLNSTFPSLPPLSQNCSSRDFAETACLCGKAAKARGRAKIEVVRIKPASV